MNNNKKNMIKSKFNSESISIKMGIIFAKLGISPNLWTVLAIIPAVFGFLSLASHNLILGTGFFIISGFIDAVDGAVARVTGDVTPYGAFLDGVIDRYVEILLYLGLILMTFSLASVIVWLVIVVFYYWISGYEERLLLERFGSEYEAYKKRVPMLFPLNIRRHSSSC